MHYTYAFIKSTRYRTKLIQSPYGLRPGPAHRSNPTSQRDPQSSLFIVQTTPHGRLSRIETATEEATRRDRSSSGRTPALEEAQVDEKKIVRRPTERTRSTESLKDSTCQAATYITARQLSSQKDRIDLQRFARLYDNNAYTLGATYHAGTGTLQIYATLVTSTGPGGSPEYHMTQTGGGFPHWEPRSTSADEIAASSYYVYEPEPSEGELAISYPTKDPELEESLEPSENELATSFYNPGTSFS
ncbi:hypothetical protein B7494_g8425 [Chlorociboria aeruginascens]|nr:hypothetical protein B7494_g8425 [Chlorociboria aeruginascens]